MSYGVNAPWGLRPMMKQGASTFDMVETYPLASSQSTYGSASSIFTGDLVALDVNGYVVPFVTSSNTATPLVPTNIALGVFVGCSYTVPTASNPTNPYQMNPVWTVNTATATGADAVAYVITDPTVMFNIQANNPVGTPLPGSGPNSIIGNVTTIAASVAGSNPYGGSFTTGQSGMMVSSSAIYPTNNAIANFFTAYATGATLVAQNNLFPLKIRGVVQVPGNTLSTGLANAGGTIGIPFVNLIVSLNNSVYNTGQIGV